MADSYTVRLPDGNEYGPADLATVRTWHEEGRIGPDCLVWKEGSPDWVPLLQALGSSPAKAAPDPTPETVALSEPAGAKPAPAARPRPAPVSRPAARRPAPSRLPLVAGAIMVVLVAAAAFYVFGVVLPGREAGRGVREWSGSERRFADESLGLSLEAPAGWSILRPANPLVPVPQARVSLGHAGTGALAFLTTETVPAAVSLDAHLEAALKARPEGAGAKDLGHADLTGAKVPARLLRSSWTQKDERYRGLTVAWRDAWNLVTLHGWCREEAFGGGEEALEALARAVSVRGTLTARIAQVTDAVLLDAPQLSRASAEQLVRERLSRGLPTGDVAAQSLLAVRRGLPSLAEAEKAELSQIYASVYAAMSEKDRVRLATYLDKGRTFESSSPQEDQAMAELVKAGVMSLPEDTRARLQALNEKAIAAGAPP